MIVSMTPAPQPQATAFLTGGAYTWNVPHAGVHIGLTVRAGRRGAVIPALASALLVGGRAWVHSDAGQTAQGTVPAPAAPVLSARYDPTTDALQLRIAVSDLRLVTGAGQSLTLHATVHTLTGQADYALSLDLDADAPNGIVRALLTDDGTYLSALNLDADAEVFTVQVQGASYTVPVTGAVTFTPDQTGRPLSVTATDSSGNVSGNLLVSVQVQGAGSDHLTPMSEWPLPPFLNATSPNLSALLGSFEGVLDVHPDDAGQALSLDAAEGQALTYLASHFGAERLPDEPDASLQARARSVLLPRKSTLAGLKAMLEVSGVFGADVRDLYSLTGPVAPLTFNGAAYFNGRHRFNGAGGPRETTYGVVLALFAREPAAGFQAARAVLERYTAAGIGVRVVLTAAVQLRVPGKTGLRTVLSQRRRIPSVRYINPFLTFDSSANFDGSQTFDGIKG